MVVWVLLQHASRLTISCCLEIDLDVSSAACLAARSLVFLTGLSPQSLLLSICAFLLRFGFSTLLIFTLYNNPAACESDKYVQCIAVLLRRAPPRAARSSAVARR